MKKYKILAIIIVIIYFFQSFFLSYGAIGADSLSYFGIAADFPELKTNLFPLGYPLLLRFFYLVFNDYFWASKFLSIGFLITILLFSYLKGFYFKETVLLFTGKTFFFVFTQALSEGPFIFLLYFILYFLYQAFTRPGRNYDILAASLLMVLAFTMRYSGIYIYLGVVFFWLFNFLKSRNQKFLRPVLFFLIISGSGIFGYLVFNYLSFGSFTGENFRGAPDQILPIYVLRDLLGITNVIDPYIGIKPASNSVTSIGFQFLVLIIDVFIFIYFFKNYRAAKITTAYSFHVLLWIMSAVYTIFLFVSGLFQQIEEMNVRMLAAANFCLFFSFLIIYMKKETSDKWIWRIGCVFLIFHTLYNLKSPDNYLKKRNQIEPQMVKFNTKKYLFNDEKNLMTTTTYYFPIINKSLKYQHTNSQKGELKQSIAGSINPKIKWLKYDTVKNKSQVLYTSELSLD